MTNVSETLKEHRKIGIPDTFEPERKTDEEIKSEKFLKGLGTWVSYFRANPHRFVSEYLQLKPFAWFQKILLFMMFRSSYFMFWASRGLGKTHLTALYCVVRCILYPDTKICVASGIKAQAMQIISEKISEFKTNCPLINFEISEFKPNMQDGLVRFHNGSWIKIVAANDNARSARANVVIVDEFRMVSEDIIKTVLTKFLTSSRKPGFVNKTLSDGSMPYATYEEPNTEIYLSSMWQKSHWSWNRFLTFNDAMLKGRPYFTCALPYQLGIKERILLKDRILNEMKEADFNEQQFKMEMETIPFGESERAFFKFADLNACRSNQLPTIPPTSQQFLENIDKKKNHEFLRKKNRNQMRVLSMDVAIMASTTKKHNDATVFTVTTCTPQGTEYAKTVDYIESIEGVLIQEQALRAKRLFYDLECDYFVVDSNGVGQPVYDLCTEAIFDFERSVQYPAWTCCNNDEELLLRCKDPEAIPVMFPIKVAGANATQTNHEMALYVKGQIQSRRLKLLISEAEASELLMKMPEYRKMSAEEQIAIRTPYIQTTFLINEMINLESEIRSGFIKLIEPTRKARKDRYSSLAYGLYFIKQKEQDLKQFDDGRDDVDLFMSYVYF